MAIIAYTGLPRSGKTYQVVCVVILGALRAGRRVVTNVICFYDVMKAALVAEGLDPEKIGTIVFVTQEQIKSENFFRNVEDNETGFETIVQPGDLVVLDEVWDIWPERGSIPERHMRFFRKHGHLVHPVSGLTCEVALISQDVKDINENIKRVVAETYRATKDTAVGSDNTYVIDIFSRGSEMKSKFLRSFKGYYNKRYFGMYKSHTGAEEGAAAPKENRLDNRGNVLKGPLFKFVIPLGLLLSVFAVSRVWGFFKKDKPADPPAAAQAQQMQPMPPKPPEARSPSGSVSTWRAVGWYSPGKDRVVVVEKDGQYRQVYPAPGWILGRTQSNGRLDEANVSTWSGSHPSSSSFSGLSK
jgi:zona occludens toxin